MDFKTVDEAQKWLRARLREGEKCPCCTQFAKVYRRKIHAAMAYGLIRFYQIAKGTKEYVSITQTREYNFRVALRGDFAKLSYWGLIEEMPKDPKNKVQRTSGIWRLTQTGINFVRGDIRIPKYVKIYDGRRMGFDGVDEDVSIRDCLGKKFSYSELMAA